MHSFGRRLLSKSGNGFRRFKKTLVMNRAFLAKSAMLTIGTSVSMKMLMNKSSSLKRSFVAEDLIQEINIGASSDFIDGVMKEVQVGDDKNNDIILVVRLDGKLYACGAKCSHFGAPLSKGMLFEDRVYCPWHLASFSVITGFPDNGPMMDGLPTYKIWESEGKVFVVAPKKIAKQKQSVPMVTRDPKNTEKYVIIGGGIAGSSAAETLRQSGFTGEIVMISREDYLPYDRTALTKAMLKVPVQNILFRSAEFLQKIGVEVQTGKSVESVDPSKKTVVLEDGQKVKYDKLLVATGTSPWVPPVRGVNLGNIFTVRDYSDSLKIREVAATAKNIVVIGGGFIGVEAASNLKMDLKDQVNVTVVAGDKETYARSLGPQVGKAMRLLNEKNGVNFKLGVYLDSFEGEGNVQKVKLADGTVLDADLVIMGTGVRPNTWFLRGLALDKDGGLNTDVFLRSTSHKDIYGAGDVASFPYFYTNERTRVEHISEAVGMGAYAAMNMTGKMQPYNGVPFFWTRAWNKSLAYVGHAKSYDKVVIDGSVEEFNFAAYYFSKGRVVAAAGMMRGGDLIALNQAMRMNIDTTEDDFNGTKLDIEKLKKKISSKRPRCFCQRGKCVDA